MDALIKLLISFLLLFFILNLVVGILTNQLIPSLLLSFISFSQDNYTVFNQPINFLPSLQHLTMGNCFNQPVDSLPSSLLSLKLGYYFNHSLDHLPSSLTSLKFYDFSQFSLPIPSLPPLTSFNWVPLLINQSKPCLPLLLISFVTSHLSLSEGFNQPFTFSSLSHFFPKLSKFKLEQRGKRRI